MKMKKQIFLYLAFALLLPSAIAFNCNSLSGGDLQVCNSIQGMNLSQADKDLLISDILDQNKTTPDFYFVYQWNTNLNIPSSPDGRTYSSGTIKNAWVKIISLMPSIIEDNTIYSSNNEKLLTAYNYNVVLPSGLEGGDCWTNYGLTSKADSLSIFLNGNLIGSNRLSSFIINANQDNLNFVSALDIRVDYYVDHYKTYWYCSRHNSNGTCIAYSSVCQFSNRDIRADSLTLADNLNARLYKSQLNSSFKVTNEYSGITQGLLNANNFTNLALSFNNSYYKYSKYLYSLNYSLPYYALTIKAEPIEYTNLNNIHVDRRDNGFYFTVADTSNCKIQLNDFFNSNLFPCNLTFNETEVSITTDQTNYFDNDTIKIYISPSDISVNLTYANQSITARNYTEFKAVLYENKIYSKLNNQEQITLINVNKKDDFETLFQLSALFFVIYFYYRTSKAYLFKWAGAR
jgi:hypothetical protein